ncbi:MAG: sodium:proton antiporter, partial [Crocinitomicaceae bacterium]
IIFGFLIAPADIINQDTIVIALMIVGGIFFIRFIQLWLFKLPFKPLLFFGPRGLITILLYVSIPSIFSFELINQSLIIQVILLTAMILMLGLVFFNESNEKEDSKSFPKFN